MKARSKREKEIERILLRHLANPDYDAHRLLQVAKRYKYANDPLAWAQDVFGINRASIDWASLPEYRRHQWHGTPNPLMAMQEAYCNKRWIAVEGAVGVGKTVWLAVLALHFWYFNPNAIVITTAPKADQLTLHIWRWIQTFFPRLGCGQMGVLNITMRKGDDRWILRGYASGVSREEIEISAARAQGIHGENVLFILEEAPGIAKAVMAAYENSATAPNNLIIAVGNPNNVHDTLHEFARRSRVTHIRISAYDHPNVVLDNPVFVPGAQTRQGLETMLEKYGGDRNNPIFLSRAEGICPEQASDSLIQWEWCIAAAQRDRSKARPGPYALGVDVANSVDGDKAAIARGNGSILEDITDFHCDDSNRLGRDIYDIARMLKIAGEYIGVDGVGVGAGTVNELKRLGLRVVDIQGGAAPFDNVVRQGIQMTEQFNNLRSQMWWQLRLDLQNGEESGIILPNDQELFVDLTTPRFRVDPKGRICIESKEEIKKRLGRSPNKGDAVVYWNWVRERRRQTPLHAEVMHVDGGRKYMIPLRVRRAGLTV